MGRTDIEDALQRLETLTKEEGLMTAARNLEVTHHVDGKVTTIKEVVRDVDSNVKEAKELTHQVGVHVNVVEGIARNIDNST